MAASILADVLVPHLGVGRDPVAQHLDAALVGQVDDLDAVLAQPLDPAVEVHRLAHHHRADVELPHQAAAVPARGRSEEHTSELQSLMRISYAVFCLKKTKRT